MILLLDLVLGIALDGILLCRLAGSAKIVLGA